VAVRLYRFVVRDVAFGLNVPAGQDKLETDFSHGRSLPDSHDRDALMREVVGNGDALLAALAVLVAVEHRNVVRDPEVFPLL